MNGDNVMNDRYRTVKGPLEIICAQTGDRSLIQF